MKFLPYYFWLAIGLLNAEIENERKNENGGFSIVGMRIVPTNNCYAKCLDSGCDASLSGKEFICMSEPYTKQVYDEDEVNRFGEHYADMVKVFSLRSGRMYECMFNESDLID